MSSISNWIDPDSIVNYLQEKFPEFLIDPEERELPYLVAGSFSRHLFDCYGRGDMEELQKGLDFIETLYESGTPAVRELATTGFLEGIQNECLRTTTNPEALYERLGVESKKQRDYLNKFRNNELPTN